MDRKGLVKRLGSAAILVPVVLGVLFAGGWWFVGLMAVTGWLMSHEWNRMCGGKLDAMLVLYGLVITAMAGLGAADRVLWAFMALISGLVLAAIMAQIMKRSVIWAVAGLVYLSIPILALVWLRLVAPQGFYLVLWILCVVWAADSVAFFAGSAIGGPKLAPAISPNKTWAGAVGGLVGASLVGVGFALAADLPMATAMFASAFVGLWAELGDLQESWIKRRLHIKDLGTLIPGHGGLLDRLDSLMFAAPVVCLMIVLPAQPWFYL